MPETNLQALNDSIELLSGYHDRLQTEVVNMAKKLQMPRKKIDLALESHAELVKIKQTITKLLAHREREIKQVDL